MPALYLLDANVLITAHNSYYPIGVVAEFWEWLLHNANAGVVKMPLETFEEIKEGGKDQEKDLLFKWVSDAETKNALVLDEQVDVALLRQVVSTGYSPSLTDDQIEGLGRDPFLIAYGLKSPSDRVVVTTEVPAPSKQAQNRRIPDACDLVGVSWGSTFDLIRQLNFSTKWNA